MHGALLRVTPRASASKVTSDRSSEALRIPEREQMENGEQWYYTEAFGPTSPGSWGMAAFGGKLDDVMHSNQFHGG